MYITSERKPKCMNDYCNREMTNIYKGIAILSVILCHFMGAFGRGITIFTPLGGIGVAIFLLLSGYGLNESWSAKTNRGGGEGSSGARMVEKTHYVCVHSLFDCTDAFLLAVS